MFFFFILRKQKQLFNLNLYLILFTSPAVTKFWFQNPHKAKAILQKINTYIVTAVEFNPIISTFQGEIEVYTDSWQEDTVIPTYSCNMLQWNFTRYIFGKKFKPISEILMLSLKTWKTNIAANNSENLEIFLL